MIAAPSVLWTPLPEGFVNASLAVVDRTILLGGGGQYVGSGDPVAPAVLESSIDDSRAVIGSFWDLPTPLPSSPNVEPNAFEEGGPAMVSAANVGGRALGVVMFQASADFAGCLGGWFRPLGTDLWEYIGSASPESDIGANDRVGIGDRVLVTSESESSELFIVERASQMDDVTWPGDMVTRTAWRPSHVTLPDGFTSSTSSDASVSASGRWIAVRGDQTSRLRDAVFVYAREPAGWALALRLDYPGFRVEAVQVTDDWLVVLESENGAARLRWRRAITGEDQHLELGMERTSLDVLGDRALLSQGTRALVVDLVRGALTHNVQGGGSATALVNGKLAPGFAVFAAEGRVGVAPL